MQINYHCAERTVEVEEDDPTILDVSTASKIPHLRECGGGPPLTRPHGARGPLARQSSKAENDELRPQVCCSLFARPEIQVNRKSRKNP